MTRHRHELTEHEWSILSPLLPNKPRGVPRVDDRRVLNGILWRFRTGSPWAEIPERYGLPTTCYNRFVQWRQAGVWNRLLESVSGAGGEVLGVGRRESRGERDMSAHALKALITFSVVSCLLFGQTPSATASGAKILEFAVAQPITALGVVKNCKAAIETGVLLDPSFTEETNIKRMSGASEVQWRSKSLEENEAWLVFRRTPMPFLGGIFHKKTKKQRGYSNIRSTIAIDIFGVHNDYRFNIDAVQELLGVPTDITSLPAIIPDNIYRSHHLGFKNIEFSIKSNNGSGFIVVKTDADGAVYNFHCLAAGH